MSGVRVVGELVLNPLEPTDVRLFAFSMCSSERDQRVLSLERLE